MFIGYVGTPGQIARMHIETLVRGNAEDQLQSGEVLVESPNIGAALVAPDGLSVVADRTGA